MEYVSPHYEYTLQLLADKLVTPERYGVVAPDLGQLALFEEIGE